MKTKFLTPALVAFFIGITFFSSCKKENVEVKETISQNLSDQEIEQQFLMDEKTIIEDIDIESEDHFIQWDDVNSISGDTGKKVKPYRYRGNAGNYGNAGNAGAHFNNNDIDKYLNNLKNLDLSSDQVAKIRVLHKEYSDCKYSSIKRYRMAISQLQNSYKEKVDILRKAYANGRITEREFKYKISELRKAYNRESKTLAIKAREAIQNCHKNFIKGIHGVLTSRQWMAFKKKGNGVRTL
ncbi:MAG: hypothetical protein Q8K70_07605 [Bacteroidota bacterium]|nr:hypothetical protein [Bacteroidota bacterium]